MRGGLARVGRAGCLLAALACGAAGAVPAGAPWSLRFPANDPLPVQGLLPSAPVGAAGAMTYPAAGVAGLLVAIATHAALAEAKRNSEQEQRQALADSALAPLRDHLAALGHRQLMEMSLERVAWSGGKSLAPAPGAPGWVVDSTPTLVITPDLRTLILNNTLAFFPPGEQQVAARTTMVRVISRSRAEADPLGHWQAGDGAALKVEIARLIAHSLELGLRDAAGPARENAPFRTLRYLEGETERMERAQLLETLCSRDVMRTLRGWILSAPRVLPPAGQAACTAGLDFE